jgi:hypothetical protein
MSSRTDNGSIAIALLLTLVGMTLSALLVPMVLTQISSTRTDVQRVRALHAAQAGLDVALGHIRAANDGIGNGTLGALPCGPLAGNVGPGTARYSVTIAYVEVDETTAIACNTGFGQGVLKTPAYALLVSTGTDRPSGPGAANTVRQLRATYIFRTTNQNIDGGLIHVYQTATSNDMCMDAGSSSPAAGTGLQMRPCTPGSDDQKFAYNTNLTLVLVASRTVGNPLGMCLDAGKPHLTGNVVQFRLCAATTAPQQQWSINDNGNFEGTTDGNTLDGYCFNVQIADQDLSPVILGTTGAGKCHQGYDNIETFSAEASVGAGAANAASGQLVNFNQFGRCIDVTETNVNYGYLIVWPCKQAPDPANVLWNQKWALPIINPTTASGTGPITTKPAAGLYCLQSPTSTAPGDYVRVFICPPGPTPAAMNWTVYTDTGIYAKSYQVTDSAGYCLSTTDPNAKPPDLYPQGQQISKLIVADCDGSTAQKWNAPPSILQSVPLKDIGEK